MRLATDGIYAYTYAYDFEGNLIARGEIATPGNVRVFAWDYRNRLTAVKDYTGYVDEQSPGTLVMEAQYTYDAGNRRISKTVDADGAGGGTAETTQFVHDGGHVVLEFDGSGSVTHRYLYGPAVDQVLSDERAGDLVWSLADHQGSVRDIIDASGSPLDTVTYTAFGEVIGDAPDFLFGYTGAVFDIETGLGYHRARYLDHATGRWLSEDPIGFDGDGANLYRYVGNSPTNATDPSGLLADRDQQGKFSIQMDPAPGEPSALNSSVDVRYNVSVYDKIIYSKVVLVVYVRTIARNFVWGGFPGSPIDPVGHGQEQWHRDNPKPGQQVGSWPATTALDSPDGPYWTDHPGYTMYRAINISLYQEWEGQAWGLSKCDGQWHLISKARWGHKATLAGGRYNESRWP